MSLSGIILGVINIAIYIAVLVLVGLIIVWFASWIGFAIPENIQRIYMVIVALIALYMIVALLFGLPLPGPFLAPCRRLKRGCLDDRPTTRAAPDPDQAQIVARQCRTPKAQHERAATGDRAANSRGAEIPRRLCNGRMASDHAELYHLRLLTLVDLNPLAAYCQAYATWRTAVKRWRQWPTAIRSRTASWSRRRPGALCKTRSSSPSVNPQMIWCNLPQSSNLRPPRDREFPIATTRPDRRANSGRSSPVRRSAKGKQRAKDVIDFIEKLTVPSGTGQGKPFNLQEWQKDFIRDIYEPALPDGRRVVRRAILSMARKNGKTALIASIALAHLVGPERIPNGEIYSAANDRDQAGIIFKFARQIVEVEPELLEKVEIIPSTKTMIARNPPRSIARYRPRPAPSTATCRAW